MLGAIAGDIIGSPYEWDRIKRMDFPLFNDESNFTDDTVLTVAIAHAILTGEDYGTALQSFARRYPNRGYGGRFRSWIYQATIQPYNSWGNGSAMRVSPVGFAFDSAEEVLRQAARSAEVSHNHPEGIKGAQATALAIFLARSGSSKEDIRSTVAQQFKYDLDRTSDAIRPDYYFNESCQHTVPEAIIAFLDSHDYEDAIRRTVSLGGDSDTLGAITGGIAEAYYRTIPEEIVAKVIAKLPGEFVDIINQFERTYPLQGR